MLVGENEGFKFHPRGSDSKLNHLCLQMTLFCAVKEILSQCMKARPSKTSIYCSGMNEGALQRILDKTGFAKGCVPFRYLGITICSKRISVADCEKIGENVC